MASLVKQSSFSIEFEPTGNEEARLSLFASSTALTSDCFVCWGTTWRRVASVLTSVDGAARSGAFSRTARCSRSSCCRVGGHRPATLRPRLKERARRCPSVLTRAAPRYVLVVVPPLRRKRAARSPISYLKLVHFAPLNLPLIPPYDRTHPAQYLVT